MNNKKFILYLAFVNLLCTDQNIFAQAKNADQIADQITKKSTDKSLLTAQDNDCNQKSDAQSVKKTKHGVFNKIAAMPRCPHGSMPVKKMNLQQLNDIYEWSLNHKIDLILTTHVLERLIALSDNHAGVKIYKLQYADSHFQLGHIDIAAIYYEDFATLYPGSQESEYALYKAVICMFELSLDPDRDQVNTKKTIALAKEFLKRSPKIEYQKEIEQVLTNCYNRLCDHEIYVFNFYLKKKKYTSAQMRLDFITTTFEKLIPDIDEKVAKLTTQLDLAMHPVKTHKKTHIHKCLS